MKSRFLNRMLFWLIFTFAGGAFSDVWSQITIIGPSTSQPSKEEYYEAQFTYGPHPYSNINWYVTGGTIVEQGVNPTSVVYCRVQWDAPGMGSISIYEDLYSQSGYLDVLIGEAEIIPSYQALSYGQVPSTLCVSYGGTVDAYQWEQSTDGLNWSAISNATNSCYTPPAIDQTRYFRCYLSIPGGSLYCGPATVYLPPLDPGTISGALQPNYNAFIGISNSAATGGSCLAVNYQYVWEQSYEGQPWNVIGTGQNYPGSGLVITGRVKIRRKITCGSQTLYSNTLNIEPLYVTTDFENLNYVRENSVLKRGVTSWYQADALPIGDKKQTTTYLDGLERPIQIVDKGLSPVTSGTWKDIVKHFEYDAGGRQTKDFLTYITNTSPGKFKNNAASEQPAYIRSYYAEPVTAPTYSTTSFDNSPLNRIIKQMQPGQSWGGNNVGVTAGYEFNLDAEKVHIWSLAYSSSAIPSTTPSAVYPAGSLVKLTETDEKGRKTINYSDRAGNVILRKSELLSGVDLTTEHRGWLCTYYVYDDFGNMRFILSPKAVQYLDEQANWALTQAVVDELCYVYQYDAKGRPVVRKQPGVGEASFVYDKKDRLVLFQDAGHKTSNQWLFNLHDEMNRTVATGLFTNGANRQNMQDYVNNSLNNGLTQVAIRVRYNDYIIIYADNPVTGGTYSSDYCNGCTASSVTFNTITHYDDYSYAYGLLPFNTTNTLAYSAQTGNNIEPTVKTSRTNSMITGEKIRTVDNDNNPMNDMFTFATAYFDESGRPLQNLVDNFAQSILEHSTNQYDFSGKLVSSYVHHSYGENFTITSRYEYDLAGRLLNVSKNYNNTYYKSIAEYAYDPFGRMKSKRLAPGYTATGKAELETLNFDYNLHGSLTGINKEYVLSQTNYNQWDRYFGMHMGFDNRDGLYSDAQFNGNLTGVIWKSQGDNSPRKYNYQYDKVDRLIGGLFEQKKRPADTWSSTEVNLSMALEYEDRNGNIKSLSHMGLLPGLTSPVQVDDLRYTYKTVPGIPLLSGNKLAKVKDQNTGMGLNNGLLGDFTDGSNLNDDYEYDVNGNLVSDLNKNIQNAGGAGITYNFLNKPVEIVMPGKSTVRFTYDGSGKRIGKSVTYANGAVRTMIYSGDFVYEQYSPTGGWTTPELKYIMHEEGRLRIISPHSQINPIDFELNAGTTGVAWSAGKQGVFDYFIRDHLGNTRMVLTEEVQKEFYKATMEQSLQGIEAPLFGAVNNSGQPTGNNEWINTRTSGSPWPGNNTDVSRLTYSDPSRRIGPNMIMKVMAGDLISSRVDYFYFNNNSAGGGSPATTVVNSLLGALSIPNAGVLNHNAVPAINSTLNNSQDFLNFINNQPNYGLPNAPKAYLNVIFLDEQFKFIDRDIITPDVGSDFARVSINNSPSYLMMQKKAPKNGWVFIYLSNQSNENVYFDNLSITQEHSRILEEAHYYPDGLKISGISARAFNKQQVTQKFQGYYSEEEEETGWNEFNLRMYDPQIGRWTAADPVDQFASPYAGMGNNPANLVDPDGGKIDDYVQIGDLLFWDSEVNNFGDFLEKYGTSAIYHGKTISKELMINVQLGIVNLVFYSPWYGFEKPLEEVILKSKPDKNWYEKKWLNVSSIKANKFQYNGSQTWIGKGLRFLGNVGISAYNGVIGTADAVVNPHVTVNNAIQSTKSAYNYISKHSAGEMWSDFKSFASENLTDPHFYEDLLASGISFGYLKYADSKISGRVQTWGTKTRGHAPMQRMMAWKYALDPRVTRVTMSRNWNSLADLTATRKGNWFPDVGVKYRNGTYKTIEIKSVTDSKSWLKEKHEIFMRNNNLVGESFVVEPNRFARFLD